MEELNSVLQKLILRWEAAGGVRPTAIDDLWVSTEQDHLLLTVQLSTPGMAVILGLPFQVEVQRGRGFVQPLGLRLGELPLPGVEELPGLLRSLGAEDWADQAESVVPGRSFDAVLELSEGAVWVDSLAVEEDGVALWLEPR